MNVTCTCGTAFEARDKRAKYCSDRCRKRAQRGGQVVDLPTEPRETSRQCGEVEKATRKELESAGRLDTALGQACLTLARRLDWPGVDTGSALSSVAGRLEDLLAKATKGAAGTATQQYQDELAARRARHA